MEIAIQAQCPFQTISPQGRQGMGSLIPSAFLDWILNTATPVFMSSFKKQDPSPPPNCVAVAAITNVGHIHRA